MNERINLATIKLDGKPGRGTLAAEREHNDDYGDRWRIIAILPDGTEEDAEVSTRWGGTLDDAANCINAAWGGGLDVWELEWIELD